jgi:CheY-like chemotaxis protein
MNRTILLVDDDENDVLFTTMALEKAGASCAIHVAADGQEALDYLKGDGKFSNRNEFPMPSLVLLDLKLPRVPGLEVLKQIRRRRQYDSVVVIVLTSSRHPDDIRSAYRLRANAYLCKPSGLEKLAPVAQAIKDFWLTHNETIEEYSSESAECLPA